MIIKLDMSSSIPIYIQLRNQILLGIASGELKIGDSLPTVRQLAEDIGVNMMTVSKAYSILKNEGYIEIDRRHGAKVCPSLDTNGEFKEKLESELSLLIAESGIKGVKKSEFMNMCSKIFDSMNIPNLIGGEA